jgi:enoyl-CoA hydratase/carnithine racemase
MNQEQAKAVLRSRDGRVLTMLLNSPANRNSLSAPGVLEGLLEGLDELDNDPELRVAVIGGEGGNFCSGGDLRQLSTLTEDEIRARMTRGAWLYRRIALSQKLIIAAVEGAAFGAGLGLAACCDQVVAASSARFCSAFVKVGAMPDAGLFWSLPSRIGVSRARRMMLFAEEVSGTEGLSIGLVDAIAGTGLALNEAQAMAARLAAGPARAHSLIKAGLRRGPMSIDDALSYQLDNGPVLFSSADFKEGATAFFEKRKPVFG